MNTLLKVNLQSLVVEGEHVSDNMALIVNPENGKVIVTENDFVHYISSLNDIDPFRFYIYDGHSLDAKRIERLTTVQLVSLASEVVDIKKWGHYFGIKSRVHSNYIEFRKSLTEIGIDPTFLPDWNER